MNHGGAVQQAIQGRAAEAMIEPPAKTCPASSQIDGGGECGSASHFIQIAKRVSPSPSLGSGAGYVDFVDLPLKSESTGYL